MRILVFLIAFLFSINAMASGPFTFQVAEAVPYNNQDSTLSSEEVKSAIDELDAKSNQAIFTISLIYNGTLSGTTFISYSNLTPNSPIIIPTNSEFVAFTYSNSVADADYTIEFRKNTTVGPAFFSVTKVNTQFFAESLPTPEAFAAGDIITVKHIDNGTNSNDAVWVLGFRAIL